MKKLLILLFPLIGCLTAGAQTFVYEPGDKSGVLYFTGRNKSALDIEPMTLKDRVTMLEKEVNFLVRNNIEIRLTLDSVILQMKNQKTLAQFNTDISNVYIQKLDSLILAVRKRDHDVYHLTTQ